MSQAAVNIMYIALSDLRQSSLKVKIIILLDYLIGHLPAADIFSLYKKLKIINLIFVNHKFIATARKRAYNLIIGLYALFLYADL